MFNSMNQSIARDRASLTRDLEYIREDVNDSAVMESMLVFESCGTGLRVESEIIPDDETEEIKEIIDQIPDDDTDAEEEIDRIVNCPNDTMDLDEVMGIATHDDPDPTDILGDDE